MSYKKVHRAGMIVYHISENGDTKMLFQLPSDTKHGGMKYQLCKGKIEEGESPMEAAIREAQEEVGLFKPNIISEIHSIGVFLGRTTVFVAEIKDPCLFGDTDDETKATKWMTLGEFMSEGRTLHKPVVKAAARAIMKLIEKNN